MPLEESTSTLPLLAVSLSSAAVAGASVYLWCHRQATTPSFSLHPHVPRLTSTDTASRPPYYDPFDVARLERQLATSRYAAATLATRLHATERAKAAADDSFRMGVGEADKVVATLQRKIERLDRRLAAATTGGTTTSENPTTTGNAKTGGDEEPRAVISAAATAEAERLRNHARDTERRLTSVLREVEYLREQSRTHATALQAAEARAVVAERQVGELANSTDGLRQQLEERDRESEARVRALSRLEEEVNALATGGTAAVREHENLERRHAAMCVRKEELERDLEGERDRLGLLQTQLDVVVGERDRLREEVRVKEEELEREREREEMRATSSTTSGLTMTTAPATPATPATPPSPRASSASTATSPTPAPPSSSRSAAPPSSSTSWMESNEAEVPEAFKVHVRHALQDYKELAKKKEAYKAEAIKLREKKAAMTARLKAVLEDRARCLEALEEAGVTKPKISPINLKSPLPRREKPST